MNDAAPQRCDATSLPEPTQSDTGRAGSRKYALVWILILGAIARIAVWGMFAGSEVHILDAQDYDRLAVGLVETGSYLTPSGKLSSLRPPLYPWGVAVGYQLFGVQNYEPIRLAQAALSLLTVVLVFRLGSLVFSNRVGLVAAGLYCFYPSGLGFNNLILSETSFTFLVTLSVWLVAESISRSHFTRSVSSTVRSERKQSMPQSGQRVEPRRESPPKRWPSLAWLTVAGIVLGLGALTRSILWLYTPLLAVLLLFFMRGSWSARLAGSALMMIAFALTIAPWAYRNTQIHKTPTLIDVMGGRNVMMGNYEHTPLERSWATIEIATGEQSWISVLRREHGPLNELTQGQIDKLAMRHGIHFMLENPGLTIKRSLVRAFNFWQLDRTLVAGLQSGYWLQLSKPSLALFAVVIMGYFAVLAFTGIFGIVFAQPVDWRLHALLLLNVAFPWMVHAAIFAHSRYHLPVMPLITIYSAVALVSLHRILKTRPRYRLWVASGLCLVLSLAWIREILMVDLGRMSG